VYFLYKNPESLSLASPFSRSYWRTALRELQNLRMLTLAAIVVALRIVLSGLYIPLGDNLNIFFGYFVNSLGAAIYGPVVALLSGFATDVLGYFVHPTGPFFPGYVLSTMLGSFFYALFFYRARVTALRVVLAKLSVNLLVNVGLGALWSAIQFSKGYYYYLVKSLAKNIGLLPVEALLLWLFLRAMAPICTKNGLLPKQEKKN
jgi:ECF transporter S component (folate family)